MRTFPCRCGNKLFFHSSHCISCGIKTGLCPACDRIVAVVDAGGPEARCGNPDCNEAVEVCDNDRRHGICNRLISAEPASESELCDYCRLVTVIPDLKVDGNFAKWRRLNRAKQRVLYTLDQIGMNYRDLPDESAVKLRFEFRADGEKPVMTGHSGGRITINIKEADSVHREQIRVEMGEPQRTLIGHFRHELGHFFWDRLIKDRCEASFVERFGDYREPNYQDALRSYYANGPVNPWRNQFVSAYASMHPWEDFAETFNAYLDMTTILDTSDHFDILRIKAIDFGDMIDAYREVGILANEFNRDMGLLDLVPEIFVPPVIEKLRYIHGLRAT